MVRWLSVSIAAVAVAFSVAACQLAPANSVASDNSADTTGSGPSLYRPGNRFAGWSPTGADKDQYLDEVQPILAKRCVTCHACTTSPCQLKLSSFEGVQRGANVHNVFSVGLFSSPDGPTRMKDATTEAEWRAKNFYSVFDGGKDSVMYRYLEHGQENAEGFDLTNPFALYKGKAEVATFECSGQTKSNVDARVAKPGTGMPFGMTALPSAEYATLMSWLEAGAPGPTVAAQAALAQPRDADVVGKWEAFFNDASSPKTQLAMRYLYEHLFYGHMHFDESATGKGDFFEIVRATTQDGPIQEIVTETPSDDPKAAFFYRFKKVTQIITAKDHTVWHLTDDVMARWTELFLDSDWSLDELPGYDGQNPFVIYDAIPGQMRDQFMIENSEHLIEAMVKGDVCNGSSATYAIRDRFWTFFLKPESDPSAIDPKLGNTDYAHLDPNSASIIANANFTSLFEARMAELKPNGLSEQDLWDGNKTDKNAWVTVFRHGKSASAHLGPLGQLPETLWVLDYANFERLYYDLVVLFKVWSKATDQVATWSTMSNVRAHGEDLFLMFLPEAMRDPLRLQFTPGVARFTESPMTGAGMPSALANVDATQPIQDFVSRIQKYMGGAIAGIDSLNPDPMAAPPATPPSIGSTADLEAALYGLTVQRGQYSDMLPEITWVTIDNSGTKLDYTLLANRIYWSNSRIIGDALSGIERRPELDSISVIRGHIGPFPELFLDIPFAEVGAAIQSGETSKAARLQVRAKYEVPRNSNRFWQFLDDEHTRQLTTNPLESGIVDTSGYLWPLALQASQKDMLN